jgi:CO/xanthine dehydrogenase FAD-binding subunit
VEEACEVLAGHGSDAKLIAGGQSLVPMMAMRLIRPAVLVDIGQLAALSFIAIEADAVRIGAGTRQAAIERDDELAGAVPLLRQALEWVGHVQTRNRGTIGGSLVHADPSAELPLAAVMLDATLSLQGQGAATRRERAREFFSGPMSTNINPEECLTELRFPRWPGAYVGSAFDEVSIRHGDFALVSACAQLALDRSGRCSRAALAIGGAGPVPLDMSDAVSDLVDSFVAAADIERAAEQAAQRLEPPADLHASAEYRRALARVLAMRVLALARERARPAASATGGGGARQRSEGH